MAEAIKLAFEATIITMIFIGIMALLINQIKERRKDDENDNDGK